MRDLKHIYYILGAAVLTSCADDVVNGDATEYLNGKEKTPIEVSALLDKSNGAGTRAAGMKFDNGDQLIAYLRHVTWNGANDGPRTSVTADQAPLLVTFSKGSTAMSAYSGSDITPIGTGVALGMTSTNTQEASDLTASPALYWDDFSNSVDAAHDLRTDNHYLQSYYGYCYNGGAPNSGTELDTDEKKAAGTIGWTVQADQKAGIKTSDLLWSAEQTPIRYDHATATRSLLLPYTHAMSKVTIEIVLDEGFDVDSDGKAVAFGSNATTPTLFANRVTTTTAPTYTHSTTVASGDGAKIQMRLADDEVTNKKARVYEAIIAPTVMKDGQKLAEVTVDGNKYEIKLTDAVLTTDPKGGDASWSSKLKKYTLSDSDTKVSIATGSDADVYNNTDGGITLPGVNYRIKITLNKQKIEVKAYITDWTDVNASIDGKIMFDADIYTSVTSGLKDVVDGSFDLWRATQNTADTDYDADGNTDGIQKASTYTITDGKWNGSPDLYWINGSQSYYFRALAEFVSQDSEGKATIKAVDGSTAAAQGTDLLWATTSKHTGKDEAGNEVLENGEAKQYEEGDAINPRTGDVPLTFKHAMAKITVNLVDANADTEVPAGVVATDYADPRNPRINLAGATVSIINLYDGATIDIHNGEMKDFKVLNPDAATAPYTIKDYVPASAASGTPMLKDYMVIPQSLTTKTVGTTTSPRETNPSFYNSTELTTIYSGVNSDYESMMPAGKTTANSSIGTGTAITYLTSDLTPVDEIYFDDDDLPTINGHNAELPGHKTAGTDVKEPAKKKSDVTYDQFKEGEWHKNITSKQFADELPQDAKLKTPAEFYTLDEYNELHPGEEKTQDQFDALADAEKTKSAATYYDYEDYIALEELPESLFEALPDDLVVVPEVLYDVDSATAYNATLDGAWHVGDVKVPAHYKLEGSKTPHSAGELKSAGDKIMIYITLADGTLYSAELSKCKVYTSTSSLHTEDSYIDQWYGGVSYIYTISLTKSDITFRAMVKNWDPVSGSGNANLDWD